MPNNYLSVLYQHIIQVENKNVGLKVEGHKHTIAPPPPSQKSGGAHAPLPPPPPPRFLRQCILNETAEFYKRLYTSEKTDNSSQNFLLNKMTRTLSDSDRDECEGEITLDEVRSAIKSWWVIYHQAVMDWLQNSNKRFSV